MGGWGERNRLDVEGRVFRFQLPNCFFPLTEVTDQGLVVMKASKQADPSVDKRDGFAYTGMVQYENNSMIEFAYEKMIKY